MENQPAPALRYRGGQHRQIDDNPPKGLKYDGKDNWLGFKHKFMRYYQVKHWTPDIAKDYLCWFLEGKASEFYASVVARIQAIGFQKCMTFLSVQNKYPATRFICQNFDKKPDIDNQKVQVADEIKRGICKYLVSSDVADVA